MRKAALLAAVGAVVGSLTIGLFTPSTAGAVVSVATSACGDTLTSDQIRDIATWSDTSTLRGDTYLDKLEDGVARQSKINDILVGAKDRRGLFSLGLQRVEDYGILPVQRVDSHFDDPEWAHFTSYEFLRRYLVNIHAQFTGQQAEPQWQAFFDAALNCSTAPSVTALAGYSAHLMIDMPRSLAAARSTVLSLRDYGTLINAVVSQFDAILADTKTIYGADFTRGYNMYFVGDAITSLAGKNTITPRVFNNGMKASYAIFFANGLALQNPLLVPGTEREMAALAQSVIVSAGVLATLGAF